MFENNVKTLNIQALVLDAFWHWLLAFYLNRKNKKVQSHESCHVHIDNSGLDIWMINLRVLEQAQSFLNLHLHPEMKIGLH